MAFDPTKPVRTRDGRPARIVCTDARGTFPVVALVADEDGDESPREYTLSGHVHSGAAPNNLDLINAPERHVRWVNVYSAGGCTGHKTRHDADTWNDSGRIACVRLEFEEGEGL